MYYNNSEAIDFFFIFQYIYFFLKSIIAPKLLVTLYHILSYKT